MAVPLVEQQSEGPTDRHPLLMESRANHGGHELVIDITRGNFPSSSDSHQNDPNDSDGLTHEDRPSTSTQVPVTQPSSSSSSTASNSRNGAFIRRGDGYVRRHRSPLNSGLWISVELVVNASQIIAAIIVLSLSRNENPKAPLFEWVIGYTVGCFATLPHLYWRYIHRNSQGTDTESTHARQGSSQNNPSESAPYAAVSVQITEGETQSAGANFTSGQYSVTANPRLNALVDHFKMALDCFFAVWFVVGNVWIFGGHSSASDAPNLYRLCIVFLTFSCIGYAMPFILCATICCCLPCIISILGLREDLTQNRGATPELLNSLPTYKFRSKRDRNRDDSESNSEVMGEGGILAAGTDKERMISAEDAVCCICLAKYADNEELRELPCAHFFHKDCVDKWLKINALCPLCKAEVGEPAGLASGANPGHRHG
uniref:E3 ubiquitin-protein ligase At4g11680 n=1 Tax=Anthurium amnicola TaxID=1678845 RepID=A0A1D1YWC5_9ARAE